MMSDAVNNESLRLPDLEALVDSLPSATMVTDRSGRIVIANTLLSSTLGLDCDRTLAGAAMWQVLPEGLREAVAAMQREVLIYGNDVHRDIEVRLSSGHARKLFAVHVSPVTGKADQPQFFSLVLHEASEKQEIAELKKLDHLKSNFMALVSHELRTPLTSIRGAIHLLADSTEPQADPQRSLIDIIQGNTDRLIRLVNNLLEIAAIDNGTFIVSKAPTSVGPLIAQAIVRSQVAANNKFINLRYLGDDTMADIDPERFIQFITYLVDNAIKFTPTGGQITVVTTQDHDGSLLVTVTDTGCGVPIQARERIFDRFFQVEDPMTRCCEGAGVGLYLARHIVLGHEGSIWVDSSKSGGSVFHAVFPAVRRSGFPSVSYL